MRKRMADPDLYSDENLALVTPDVRWLFQGIQGLADDRNATFPHRPKWIKAHIFPYDEDIKPINVEAMLFKLEKAGKLAKFWFADEMFWFIPDFLKYQRIDRPSKSKYPAYDPRSKDHPVHVPLFSTVDEDSTSTRPELKNRKNINNVLSESTGDKAVDILNIRDTVASGMKFS